MDSLLLGISQVLDPSVLIFVAIGVVVGSFFAAVPGLGGLVPIGILLPWAVTLEPFQLVGLLFGIAGVANTANSFPSILIAVPGSVGSQATIVDGFPMAQRGEAARAFGAAFTASAFGSVVGALALVAAIPVMRPLVLLLGSPELFMLIVVALTAVGTLSTGAFAKGIVAALAGLIVATVGMDIKSGIPRFSFGTLYFWDGIDLVLIGLGLFAVPEILQLGMKRGSIAERQPMGTGLRTGIRDAVRSWYLMIRCSAIGVWIGFLPGVGGSVVDWVAYSHATQSERRDPRFGKGDVRGVIAPEAANSSKEGGALIPTLAFGIPGSAGNALILVGMISVGLAPGPQMLTAQVHVIYAVATVLLIAGLAAAALSLGLSNQVAKVALLPHTVLVPSILGITLVAAYAASYSWFDILVLVLASGAGFYMRRYGWPRPPLMLGAVLGAQAEQYLWLSVQRYQLDWLGRPGVLVLLAVLVALVATPMVRTLRARLKRGGQAAPAATRHFRPTGAALFAAAVAALLACAVVTAWGYPTRAGIMIVSGGTLALAMTLGVVVQAARVRVADTAAPATGIFDFGMDDLVGGLRMWGWFAGAIALAWAIGFVPGVAVFIAAYALVHRAGWREAAVTTAIVTATIWVVFGWLMDVAWPEALIAAALP